MRYRMYIVVLCVGISVMVTLDGVTTSTTVQDNQNVTTQQPSVSNGTSTPIVNTTLPKNKTSHVDISKEEAKAIYNTTSTFLDDLLDGVDIRLRPVSDDEGGPVTVDVNFHVNSFSSISEPHMEYKLDIYLRQNWVDKRLAYNKTSLAPGQHYVKLTHNVGSKIWLPDLFFPNEKKAERHMITVPNELVIIYPSGSITYSLRLSLTVSCLMELHAFPLDSQDCSLIMESYSYSTMDMVLVWSDNPVQLNQGLSLAQFELILPVKTLQANQQYTTGVFPGLRTVFHLKRHLGFYMLQTYIPSALIIVLSWVSFWINMEAVPARVSLSVTTVMTMVAQLAGSKASIPNVSYPKALDVWMTMGMLFVFAALIEYALVNSLDRKSQKQKLYKKTDKLDDTDDDIDPDVDYKQRARRVDKVSRLLFPLVFVLFNVLYWPLYTSLDTIWPEHRSA